MRFACAEDHSPIPNCNDEPPLEHKGLVLHIMEGQNIEGADSWFRNPTAEASANFGCAKDGRLWQWVDTDDQIAWAQGWDGNRRFVSVECAGAVEDPDGGALTPPMIESIAGLYAEGVRRYAWPIQQSDNPINSGLGWHGMGAASGRPDWGHPFCPGEAIKNQRPLILSRVRELLGQAPPVQVKKMEKLVQVCEFTDQMGVVWVTDWITGRRLIGPADLAHMEKLFGARVQYDPYYRSTFIHLDLPAAAVPAKRVG